MVLLPLYRNSFPKAQTLWLQTSLTSKTVTVKNPPPSSDGWIAFLEKSNIWVVHPNGSGLKQITFDGDDGMYKWVLYGSVSWSRDGTKLFAIKAETPDILTQFSYSLFQLDVADFRITINPLKFYNDEESLHIETEFNFSPDEKSIAFHQYVSNSEVDRVMIMNLETGKSRTLFEIHNTGNEILFFGNIMWSSDGKVVNFSSTSINIDPNSELKPWMNHFINIESLFDTVIPGYCLLSPQGDRLACLEINPGGPRTQIVTIIDTRNFAVHKKILFNEEVYEDPVWADDNRNVVIKTGTPVVNGTTFYLVDSDTGKVKEIIEKSYNASVVLSPDGNWIVGRFDFEGNIILVNTSDGKRYPLTKGDGLMIWQPQITTSVNPALTPVLHTGSNVINRKLDSLCGPR
jgi:Tol biopolymer transport system component